MMSKKHKTSRSTPSEWSEWSEWTWDAGYSCFRRSRSYEQGMHEYQYSGPSEDPRSVADTPGPPHHASSSFQTRLDPDLYLEDNIIEREPRNDDYEQLSPDGAFATSRSVNPSPLHLNYNYPTQSLYANPPEPAARPTEQEDLAEVGMSKLSLRNASDAESSDNQSPSAPLEKRYKVITHAGRFFRVGRVFKALWTEPLGNTSRGNDDAIIDAKYGEKAYTKIRRFVVVREKKGRSLCLTMTTFNGKQMGKDRVNPDDYAAVYRLGTDREDCKDDYLTKEAFPIKVEEPNEVLSSRSRLDFGRVFTVEHNIKVLRVGRIPDSFLPKLQEYYRESVVD